MKKQSKAAIDYEALAAFRHEIRRFLNFSSGAAHSAGIEPQQHQALLAIKGRPLGIETTVGGLAVQMQILHHSAVELSRRLEAKGWIRRSRSGTDRREVLLLLSPRGEKLLGKLSLSHHDELQTAGPKLIKTLQSVIAPRKQSRARRAAKPGRRNR
jgi:DNA-binding MarR family transcriptional regulator